MGNKAGSGRPAAWPPAQIRIMQALAGALQDITEGVINDAPVPIALTNPKLMSIGNIHDHATTPGLFRNRQIIF